MRLKIIPRKKSLKINCGFPSKLSYNKKPEVEFVMHILL